MHIHLFKKCLFQVVKKRKIFFLLFFILHTQSLSAGVCSSSFERIYSKFIDNLQTPAHIRKVKKITGLTDAEIKDSVILDVGSFFTYNFAEYARTRIGAKEALVVNSFTDRPANVEHHLYDVPENRFLRMTPLTTEPKKASYEPAPFDPHQIREKLGGTLADITLSLSVIGTFNIVHTKLWMEQLTKVTKPNGLIIVDFGNHVRRSKFHQMSTFDFERILSQLKDEGLITHYEAQHTNHRFIITRLVDIHHHPSPSTTYWIINGSHTSR